MPQEFEYNPNMRRIEVRTFGELEINDWRNDLVEIGKLSETHNCRRLLADITELEIAPTMEDIYNAVDEFLPPNVKYALVSKKDAATGNENRFFETTSLTKGISVAIFFDKKDAESWLMT